MKDTRPGTLVCVCDADGRILLNAPYDCEDVQIAERRKRRISATGRASNGRERGEENAESDNV